MMHKDFYKWFKDNCEGKSKYDQLMALNAKCNNEYLMFYPYGSLNSWLSHDDNYVKCVRFIMNDGEPVIRNIGNCAMTIFNHAGKSVPVVDDVMNPTKKFEVTGNTMWVVNKAIKVDGILYFCIGLNMWVNSKYVEYGRNGND